MTDDLPSRVVVDTNVFIDAARGWATAAAWLESVVANGVDLLVSAITLAEYASGVAPGQRDAGLAYLESLLVIPVTASIATRAGGVRYAQARLGRALSLPDALIAATALETGVPLVTSNLRDFVVAGPIVVPPVLRNAPRVHRHGSPTRGAGVLRLGASLRQGMVRWAAGA